MHGVLNNGLYFRLPISRKRLVARTKIEDSTVTPFPAAAGAKDFPSLEPRNEDGLLRSGNSERFAVHLFVRDFEVCLDSLSDRMAGVADPKAFLFSGFAPDQGAGCTHQALKDLRVVARMKHDQSHPFQNTLLHAPDDFVRHLSVGDMAPP